MSLVTFEIAKETITEEDRERLIEITQIIEQQADILNKDDYQEILNFIMEMNREFNDYLILKILASAPIPHISDLRERLRSRIESIKQRIGI
ncbi:MAG: hypothetical protein ACXAC7_06250 [Candidatus Hodarchaeales archaeon]|jgi:LPS O-antigen subunit length determinant protein (WzzB/FepE family)